MGLGQIHIEAPHRASYQWEHLALDRGPRLCETLLQRRPTRQESHVVRIGPMQELPPSGPDGVEHVPHHTLLNLQIPTNQNSLGVRIKDSHIGRFLQICQADPTVELLVQYPIRAKIIRIVNECAVGVQSVYPVLLPRILLEPPDTWCDFLDSDDDCKIRADARRAPTLVPPRGIGHAG